MMREQVAQEILDNPKRGDEIKEAFELARRGKIYTKQERGYVEAYEARRAAEISATAQRS